MISKIFSVLVTTSFVFALLGGRMSELSQAVIDGSDAAVRMSFSMLGMMCLWSGIIRIFEKAGMTELISKLVRPFLKFLYPSAYRKNLGINEISANFAANLLGLGNAALPLGLAAAEKLSKNESPTDLYTFGIMNTVPIQLIPTTLIALRTAAGSLSPYDIIPPIYTCSCLTTLFAAFFCRFLGKAYEHKRRQK